MASEFGREYESSTVLGLWILNDLGGMWEEECCF